MKTIKSTSNIVAVKSGDETVIVGRKNSGFCQFNKVKIKFKKSTFTHEEFKELVEIINKVK